MAQPNHSRSSSFQARRTSRGYGRLSTLKDSTRRCLRVRHRPRVKRSPRARPHLTEPSSREGGSPMRSAPFEARLANRWGDEVSGGAFEGRRAGGEEGWMGQSDSDAYVTPVSEMAY